MYPYVLFSFLNLTHAPLAFVQLAKLKQQTKPTLKKTAFVSLKRNSPGGSESRTGLIRRESRRRELVQTQHSLPAALEQRAARPRQRGGHQQP